MSSGEATSGEPCLSDQDFDGRQPRAAPRLRAPANSLSSTCASEDSSPSQSKSLDRRADHALISPPPKTRSSCDAYPSCPLDEKWHSIEEQMLENNVSGNVQGCRYLLTLLNYNYHKWERFTAYCFPAKPNIKLHFFINFVNLQIIQKLMAYENFQGFSTTL